MLSYTEFSGSGLSGLGGSNDNQKGVIGHSGLS